MKNKKIRMILKIVTISAILIMALSTIVFGADSDEEFDVFKGVSSVADFALSGFVGIILYLPKLIMLVIALAIQGILSLVLSVTSQQVAAFTPATMLFNKISLLDINFFSMTVSNTNSALYIIKENIAKWYVGLRYLSTGALLAVIGYIGIRMALSTVAEDKSKYKKLLRYWVESFALLFVLHYIMIAVINFNDAIVSLFSNSFKDQTKTVDLLISALKPTLSGMAAAIVYTMTVGVTAAFFVMYLKRVMMVGFLIVIAPLITITYSIDKVGDGKSQALNQWLKLFMYNVLIQPFHCILYLIFVSQSANLVTIKSIGSDIASSILAVVSMMFIFKAEEILKQIFGFDKAGKSMMSGLVAGSMVGKAAGKVSGLVAKGAGKAGKRLSKIPGVSKVVEKGSQAYDKAKSVPILGGGLKFGEKVAKAVPDMVIPTMVAPTSGSAAFSMLTSSLDSSKQKRELEGKLDDVEKEINSKLEDFLKGCKDNKMREERLIEAYSIDFSKSEEVMNAYNAAEKFFGKGKGIEYLQFAQNIQSRVDIDVKLNDDKNKMESLKEIIDSTKK